ISVSSGRSPGSTLPPGNSHRPASCLPSGRWAMSTRPSTSRRAQAATRTSFMPRASRTVVAVDGDIFLRQVAGPHRRLATAEAEIDPDGDLVPLHVGGGGGLVIGGIARAFVGHADVAEEDGEPVALGRLARLADGHDDAAPVGVLA